MTTSNIPMVTVYITNYNYGRYIRQAIESVLNQTFENYELIIIDDGSTDDSRKIISEYEGHRKVRIIFQENKGLNRTNNIALKASRGRYIMRLDADDYLDPNALLVMTSIIDSDPDLGMVFPDYYYIDSEGRITGHERRHDFSEQVSLQDQPAHGACTLIRKRALIGVGGYSENYRCQDGYDLWLKFIEKHRVSNINLPLFYYRRHNENLTANNGLMLETRASIKKDHIQNTQKPPLSVLAILPVRGPQIDPGTQILEELGGKKILDWTIEAAFETESVERLILSTPDEAVKRHVKKRFGDLVLYHDRPLSMARENVQLDRTMEHALEQCRVEFNPGAYLTLYPEHPLRSAMFMDKAVNTMRIFNVDCVIGVMPESDVYFRHNGTGLEVVGNNFQMNSLRLERDYLYRMTGGLQLVRSSFYKKTGKRLGGIIGHIVLDEFAATRILDSLSLEQAKLLLSTRK